MPSLLSPAWFIVLLPTLAALGPYLLPIQAFGVTIFGFRLAVIMLALFATPLTSSSAWWFNKVASRAILFGVFWTTYAVISLYWTPDPSGGLVDIQGMIFGFAVMLVLFNLKAYESRNIELLRLGWIAAFVLTSMVGVWEILTGNHLQSEFYLKHTRIFDSKVIQSTLGGPGPYGGFLLLCVPFILWSFGAARGWRKIMYGGMLIGACVLLLYTQSRTASIGLAMQLLLAFIFFERRWFVIMPALLCAGLAYLWWVNVFLESDFRLAQKWSRVAGEEGFTADSSVNTRSTLSLNGLYMVYATGGRGVGAAGFEEENHRGDMPFPLMVEKRGTAFNAHNFWVEVLSEYGILPFAGLMAILGHLAVLALRARSVPDEQQRARLHPAAKAILVGLVGYFFFGIGAGSVMLQSQHWVFLSSLVVLGAFLHAQLESRDAKAPRPGLVRLKEFDVRSLRHTRASGSASGSRTS